MPTQPLLNNGLELTGEGCVIHSQYPHLFQSFINRKGRFSGKTPIKLPTRMLTDSSEKVRYIDLNQFVKQRPVKHKAVTFLDFKKREKHIKDHLAKILDLQKQRCILTCPTETNQQDTKIIKWTTLKDIAQITPMQSKNSAYNSTAGLNPVKPNLTRPRLKRLIRRSELVSQSVSLFQETNHKIKIDGNTIKTDSPFKSAGNTRVIRRSLQQDHATQDTIKQSKPSSTSHNVSKHRYRYNPFCWEKERERITPWDIYY